MSEKISLDSSEKRRYIGLYRLFLYIKYVTAITQHAK